MSLDLPALPRVFAWASLSLCAALPAYAAEDPADEGETIQTASDLVPTADPKIPSDPLLAALPPPKRVVQSWREALDLLRKNSLDLRRANAQVTAARGQARVALAAALPNLSASAQLNHHLITGTITDATGQTITQPNPQTIWGASANLQMPIFAPAAWFDYGTAKDQVRQSELAYEDTERRVIAGLAEALVSLLTTERTAEVSRVSLEGALGSLELNRRRAELGMGVQIDVLRAEQEVARSRAQVINANEAVERAREALGLALGLAEPAGITPDLDLDDLSRDAQATCESKSSIDDRPDILAQRAAEDLGRRRVRSVSRAFWPTLTANSTLSYSGFSRFSPNGGNTTWTIGAVLNWNLYDGGVRYGLKRQREAEVEQAAATTEELRRSATIEVNRALRAVTVAENALKVSEDSRNAATKNAALARAKLMLGSGSSFDVVDTQRAKREAELDVTVREFEVLRSRIQAFLVLASCDL